MNKTKTNSISDIDVTIAGVLARSVDIPLEFPVQTSVGLVATAPLVLIDITTSNGVVGHAYLFTYTPMALRAMRELVQALGNALVGQPLAPVQLDALLSQRLRLLGKTGLALMACSGLDMAAWDALARHHRLPLATLLGATPRPVPAYDSHSMEGLKVGVTRAARARDEGYRAIKTKIGYPTLAEDIEVVRALRKTIGDDMELMVDYNQSLSIPEAVRRIHALQGEGVSWVEEPTLQDDWKGHAAIRRKAGLPIQMGENWCGIEEMSKALDADACDLAMPDAMKIGGVTGWLRAAALAKARNMPMSSHLMHEITTHLMLVTPTAHWLERMEQAGPILRQPQRFVDGNAIPADEPGSGVAWDEDAVTRYLAN
ncbi:enolase C-terminal domain-like protein [Rhizobium rhizogenes]|uniref:enolase C-terminal domain-like protein n=1 Tax=Rhizobium rhizogenes TaxID=359 RepID=UPI00286913E6|nr:enolase C-terminal domain-like protein [Rhizobium rhizogenes]